MWPFRKKEERASDTVADDATLSEANDAFLQALLGSGAVTKQMALEIPTVSGALDLIANIIASTPIKLYRDGDGKAEEIKKDPRLRLLNDDTGDTLSANEFWRAIVRDYFLGQGGYAYINLVGTRVQSLHYVDESHVSIVETVDPIFKDFNICVNGQSYYPFQFLKVLRNTKNGATGMSITKENSRLIEVGYASLMFERNTVKRGGNKKGFLKSEKRMDADSLEALKTAFTRLYSAESEGSDSFVLLNNGIDFKESSNTSVELQLNENKKTNAEEFAKLFHIPTDVIAGNATDAQSESLAKLAAIPLISTIQCALNRDLLLESEKSDHYFAFDTKELLKGDIKSRFEAYAIALDKNFMQIDEVRYAEDLEKLGFNWIKLGLQDVLYNPDENVLFAPNTGKMTTLTAADAGKEVKTI